MDRRKQRMKLRNRSLKYCYRVCYYSRRQLGGDAPCQNQENSKISIKVSVCTHKLCCLGRVCVHKVPYVTSYRVPAVAITEASEASMQHKYHKNRDSHSGWSFSGK